MPFVEYYKWSRLKKARRRAPEWQDVRPTEAEQRETYAIAARNVGKFSRAFLEAIDTIMTPSVRRAFIPAYNTGSINEVMAVMPFYYENESNPPAAWANFTERISRAYAAVINASGEAVTARMNRKFGTNMRFNMSDEPDQHARIISKAAEYAPGAEVPYGVAVVPVNPYSIQWMNSASTRLITGVSNQQRKIIQQVLAEGFEQGLRPENAYAAIQSNIGLTSQGHGRLLKRQLLMEEAGIPKREMKKQLGKYKTQLLQQRAQLIGRTETIAAEAQGRNAAWRMAQDNGELGSNVERVWITAPGNGNPNRPCEQCEDLDGQTAPIGGDYNSIYGPVDMPPAHPACRCGESIRRKEQV